MQPWFWRAIGAACLMVSASGCQEGSTNEVRIPSPDAKLANARPEEEGFTSYRGANRTGIIAGPALTKDWTNRPPRMIWKKSTGGGGFSGFTEKDGKLFTIEQRGKRETVVCYAAQDGAEVWTFAYEALFPDGDRSGPRATPTVEGDQVYALGAEGDLHALDRETGKKKWAVNILEDNKAEKGMWGVAGSPLVYDNLVIVNPGAGKGRNVVAYDCSSGKFVHGGGQVARAGYSSPMLVTLDGVRQVVCYDGDGVAGYDDATGEQLWRYPWFVGSGVNAAQPIVLSDGRVYVSSAYDKGGVMIQVSRSGDDWKTTKLWENSSIKAKFESPLWHSGYIYGLDGDQGVMVCVDAETGDRRWKNGRFGLGKMLLTNDTIVVLCENGDLAMVAATAVDHKLIGRQKALSGNRTWNSFALVDGRAYIRNEYEMACYDLRAE